MNQSMISLFNRRNRDQRGGVAVLAGVLIFALVGVGALAVDTNSFVNARRILQASTDAAALAGAQNIAAGTAVATATTYSSGAGDNNAHTGLTATMVSGYPMLKCFATTGITCVGTPPANGIVVKQQASVPTYFGSVFGINSVSLSTTATAGTKGGSSKSIDLMIILDTTASMNSSDSSCSATRIDCALAGIRSLLGGLWPSLDQVGLMVFPGVTSGTVGYDFDCSSSNPTTVAYNALPVYQIIVPTANYRTSNTAPLDPTSNIVKAARGGSPGCTQGIAAVGGFGTFYADTITAAQTALTSSGRPNVQKAIVLLSDGDASASASDMPSGKANNQCKQAITAAQAAKTAGTWIYSIAYTASTSSSCSTDSPTISACATMQQIALQGTADLSRFYSSTTACVSPNSISSLSQIFKNIGSDMTSARLLSDNTT